MAFDISKLKSISNSTLSTLSDRDSKRNFVDDRFWKITRDKSGNGAALIRFLPSLVEGQLPWVEQWKYAIQGPNGWYIENSLRTIGKSDPMAEYIGDCWRNASTEEEKNKLRRSGLSKARHTFVANILVIKDPANPENDGKVKLFEFGQQIYNMIVDKAKDPLFPGDIGNVNVVDWDNGANFRLNIYTKDSKFPSYERSSFDNTSSIGSDERILEIANQMYDLSEFVEPSKFKSYDELKERVNKVFNLADTPSFASEPRQDILKPMVQNNDVQSSTKQTFVPQSSQTSPQFTHEKPVWDTDQIDFDELMKDI